MLVSSSVLKDDNNLRIFKESPNEFEYMVKRHDVDDRKEDIESKERRSTIGGSSFIRFGRGFNTMDNSAFDNEINSKVNRHPRWKSPDIVIRLGRSGIKATNSEQPKRGKNDLNFIRFGRNVQIVPADLDLSTLCSALMSNGAISDAGLHPDVTSLFRLCNKITGKIDLDTLETDSNRRE